MENGLVDEVMFWVKPTIQGPEDRPFHDDPRIDLELLGSRSFDSRVTLLHYRPVSCSTPTAAAREWPRSNSTV